VGNNPIDSRDPTGLLCAGGAFSGSAYAGNAALSGGATIAAGGGGCSGTEPNLADASSFSFASGGAYAGSPYGIGEVSLPDTNRQDNVAFGAYAGGGQSFFLSTANNAKEFASTTDTISFDGGIGPLKVGFSINYGGPSGVITVNVAPPLLGDGVGASLSKMASSTQILSDQKYGSFGSSPSPNISGNVGRTCSIANRR
jgi:hypothetical protein